MPHFGVPVAASSLLAGEDGRAKMIGLDGCNLARAGCTRL